MKRHMTNLSAPEVSPETKVYGGGMGMPGMGTPKNILPYSSKDHPSKGGASGMGSEGLKKAGLVVAGIWFLGWFMGYELLWPVYLVLDILQPVLSIPPFSWIYGLVQSPFAWVFSWFNRGAPLVEQVGALQEMRLPADQVPSIMEAYVQQYGDAALIFASHDGYAQIVSGLLSNKDLGMRELIDATDDNGNTALIYAASKGFRQCTATLLRTGADVNIANQGNGGRTALMEASGGGHKDIVNALCMSKAHIDTTDDFGNTALHYAAYHGHLGVVQELLKLSPNKELKNSYGHTPASYAAANRHKGIADLINRYRPRPDAKSASAKEPEDDLEALMGKARAAQTAQAQQGQQKEAAEGTSKEDLASAFTKQLQAMMASKNKEEKHVKGSAEDLHKRDKEFAPGLEHLMGGGITDSEKKALEEQVAKLRRQHEEQELKAQKKIVELLEKNSAHQKAVDEAEREARNSHLNATELALRVQELESKHQATELRAMDEKSRADRLQEDVQRTQLDMDRHKSRADGAERERDLHMEASRRHEENLRRKHEEVNDHLSRIERQTHELSSLREDMRRREDEIRQHRDVIARLEHELKTARGDSSVAQSALPPPAPPPAPQPAAPVPDAAQAAAPATALPVASPEAPAAPQPAVASDVRAAAPASGAAAGDGAASPPSSGDGATRTET